MKLIKSHQREQMKTQPTELQQTITASRKQRDAFTLTELLISITILGILSTIALPNFTRQFSKAKQSEAIATLTQFQQKLASYVDVYKAPPPSWKSLSDYSLVMTASGPASEITSFTDTTITLPGGNYEAKAELTDSNLYTFTATPTNPKAKSDGYNAIACLDLNNGATDYKKGPIERKSDTENDSKSPSATKEDLKCRPSVAP